MPKPSFQAQASLRRAEAIPPFVAARLEEAYRAGRPPARGTITALDRFFAGLETAGRPVDRPNEEDFQREGARTGFRTLIAGLRRFAPEVPLAEAASVRRRWDKRLNDTYNKKPKKPRPSTRIAHPPEAWSEDWQAALPTLDRPWKGPDGKRHGPLEPRSRAHVVQAVGMLAAALDWARTCGVPAGAALDEDALEIFSRYLFHARATSARTSADYIERVRILGRRGGLFDRATDRLAAEIICALREETDDGVILKARRLQTFNESHTLADFIRRAEEKTAEAATLPGCSATAAKLRREAVVLAGLLNTADRQGDFSALRIGFEIERLPSGLWSIDLHQQKTDLRKTIGALWPLTSRLIDTHILGDRPPELLAARIADLNGCNLLSLSVKGFAVHYPSSVFEREFGITAHPLRSLICNLIRRERPDSAWAVQAMLGHANQTMQREYETEFRRTASGREWHAALEELQRAS